MTIKELRKRSNRFVSQFDKHSADAVKSNGDFIVALNRSQMEQGLTSKDVGIYPGYRSKYYAFKKANMGSKAPMGTPDLKLTGSFHAKMYLRVVKPEYEISSRDKKTTMLEDNYPDIFGLTPESIKKAQAVVIQALQEKYKKTVLE